MASSDELLADYLARIERQGPEHVDTLQVRSNLVAALIREGHYPEAVRHAQGLVETRTRLSGSRRLDTMKARRNHALALGLSGDVDAAYAEALQLHRLVNHELGPSHELLALVASDVERWRAAGGEPAIVTSSQEEGPTDPEAPAAPIGPSTRQPPMPHLQADVVDVLREHGGRELRWYELRAERSTFPPRPSRYEGFGVVVGESRDGCSSKAGCLQPAAFQVRVIDVVGWGSKLHMPFCEEHTWALHALVVGDSSGRLFDQARRRTAHTLASATRRSMSSTALRPDHVLFFSHINDVALQHGRSTHAVLIDSGAGSLQYEFVLFEIDDDLENAVPTPHLGPESFRALLTVGLEALPRGAEFRGIEPDRELSTFCNDVMRPLVKDVLGSGLRWIESAFAVACVNPRRCTRAHLEG